MSEFELGFNTQSPLSMLVMFIQFFLAILVVWWFGYVLGKYQVFNDHPVCVNKHCTDFEKPLNEAQRDWQAVRDLLRKVVGR